MQTTDTEQFIKYATARLKFIAERTAYQGLDKQAGIGSTLLQLGKTLGRGMISHTASGLGGSLGVSGLSRGLGKIIGAGRKIVEKLPDGTEIIKPMKNEGWGFGAIRGRVGQGLERFADKLDDWTNTAHQKYMRSVDHLTGINNLDDVAAKLTNKYKDVDGGVDAIQKYVDGLRTGLDEKQMSTLREGLHNTFKQKGGAIEDAINKSLGRNSGWGKFYRYGPGGAAAVGLPIGYSMWSMEGDHKNPATKALALPGKAIESVWTYGTPLGLGLTATSKGVEAYANSMQKAMEEGARMSSKLISSQLADQNRAAYLYALANPKAFASQLDNMTQQYISQFTKNMV